MFISLRQYGWLCLFFIASIPSVSADSLGSWLFDKNTRFEALLAGVEARQTMVDDNEWHYYLKADQDHHQVCTVLVHGFTAEAAHWLRFAKYLDSDCLIIPDLPAHGHSFYQLEGDYSVATQTQRLHTFLTQLNLADSYHLAGSSMGGHIVASFALAYPEQTASLTLFNAAGVSSPQDSEMDKIYSSTGRSIFEVENNEQYQTMLKMTMSEQPWVPGLVTDYLAQQAIKATPKFKEIFKQIHHQDRLDNELANIKAKTLVVWGDEDKLLHPAMANVYANGIPDSQLIELKQIGHLPFLEIPEESAELYKQFISQF